ncbi:hypothetical protein CSCA_3472 [Clostridium scatologenes]|uniref:Uncharacterized protein n=1 Tax=Clostridium scatologenes TaxID=1548 RepID=A0A0E3M7D3_CLOSL|nr:hypothetical protein CSCA_3472 [Clostridium scatologenes]
MNILIFIQGKMHTALTNEIMLAIISSGSGGLVWVFNHIAFYEAKINIIANPPSFLYMKLLLLLFKE